MDLTFVITSGTIVFSEFQKEIAPKESQIQLELTVL